MVVSGAPVDTCRMATVASACNGMAVPKLKMCKYESFVIINKAVRVGIVSLPERYPATALNLTK